MRAARWAGRLVPALALAALLSPAVALAADEPRREDRGELIVLHLYGSYHDMGRQQVELLGPVARRVYELQREEYRGVRARLGFGFALLDRIGVPLLVRLGPLYERSGLHDEMNGFADALDVSRADMTRAALAIAGASTVFAATRGATADGGAIIGRNADWWDGYGRRRPLVVHYHPTNGDLAYVLAGWPLVGAPVIGINEAGFATSFNFFVTDSPIGTGLPQWPHRRALQTARSVEEGIRAFTEVRQRGMPTFMVMADAGGDIAMVECVPADCAVFRPDGDWFAHANHARTPRMIPVDRYRSEDSFRRLAAMEAAVPPHLGRITPEVAARILRDRGGSRYVNDPVVGNLNVLNAAVVQPTARVLWHSTTMQPLAPFGEMVPFSVGAGVSRIPALLADPRLGGPEMAHEAAVVAEVRRAVGLFDEGQVEEARAIWDALAARREPILEPHRLAWARARVRWASGLLPEAEALLADADRDEAPFEVRSHALVVRAMIADRLGRRDDAVRLYRETLAYLATHPDYTDRFIAAPVRAWASAGVVERADGMIPPMPDLQYVPR
jgi:hypothetical protein